MFSIPSFLKTLAPSKHTEFISVDLGGQTTKAVLLERKGDTFRLSRYAILDAPTQGQSKSPEQLTQHLLSVTEALATSTKKISITISMGDTVIRQVEMPPIPADEIRTVLKTNHKSLLHQDLPHHVFDCHVAEPAQKKNLKEAAAKQIAPAHSLRQKYMVLVAAAKQQLVLELKQAANTAGLQADAVVPSLVGLINAFEAAMPTIFSKEIVALVDIGFKHTSICVLDSGELVTNRLVNIGGHHITNGLAETLGISYAEAEALKIGMASELDSELENTVGQLSREIHATLNFFENQRDRPVTHVYITGGTSRSEVILSQIEAALMIKCSTWNPMNSLQVGLSGQQTITAGDAGHQLAIAIGSALSTY